MKILSDFRDHYDIWSNGKGVDFYRYSESPPAKLKQFEIITNAGFWVIPHGTVYQLAGSQWQDFNKQGKLSYEPYEGDLSRPRGKINQFVIYEDDMKHRGEGKSLLSSGQMKRPLYMGRSKYDDYYDYLEPKLCSAYCPYSIGKSLRLLQIGRCSIYIEMWSRESWQSNVGDGGEQIVGIQDGLLNGCPEIPLPLWAIDFVWGEKEFLGIDFNVSPGTKVDGLGKHFSAYHIQKEINYWLRDGENYKKYQKFIEELGIKDYVLSLNKKDNLS